MNLDTCKSVLRTALLGGALDSNDAVRSARAELGGMPLALNALASTMGTKLRIRFGTSALAQTDGKTIDLMNLPIPTDRADIDTFVLMLSLAYGLGYHELGHVSESDFKVLNKLNSMMKNGKATPLVESFFRIIEDVRMESAFIHKWPNTRKYLDSLTQSLLLTGFYTHVDPKAAPMSALTGYLLYRLYHDYRGDTGTLELALEARAVCVQQLTEPVITRLDALLPQMRNLADTSDALIMAKNLAMFIEDEKKKQEEQQQQQDAGNPNQPQTPDQRNGAGKDQQQASDGQSGDSSQGSDPGKSGDQNQGAGQPSMDSSSGNGAGGSQVLQALESLLDPTNADPRIGERADAIRDALAQAVSKIEPDCSGMLDIANAGVTAPIAVAPDACNTEINIECNMEEALSITAPLRRSYKKLMQAATEAQVSVNRRGRKLSGNHLHRVAGGDNRVFKSVSEEIDVDTAVTIALDSSGSMRGWPIKLTCEAVYATAVALEGIEGITCSALSFPGNKVLLPFGSKAKRRSDHFRIKANGCTPTDEAIYLGTRMLLSQRKSHRVLIIVTDGRPDSEGATKVAAEHALSKGIELYVIGIGDVENVCNFENWHYLQTIHGLPPAVTALFTPKRKLAA